MTQTHNIIKNEKNNYIKYVLQDLEINENDTIKMYEAGTHRKIDYHNKRRTYLKQKKAVRNHSKILRTHFLYKCNTNAERITNTHVNTIHIIRNKKSSMDSKNNISPRMDQIDVELIKYSPEVVYEKIADIQQYCSHRKARK